MTTTSASASRWLKTFAVKVHEELQDTVADPLIVLLPLRRLKVEESDTDGWFVTLGHIRGIRGRLQVWFDSYAKANGRRVSVCFQSTTDESPLAIAKGAKGELGRAVVFTDDAWAKEPDGEKRLVKPLPSRLYERPIVERYEGGGSWKFYVMYLRDGVKTHAKPKAALVGKAVDFLTVAARRACGLRKANQKFLDYPDVENRKLVKTHLTHERPEGMARRAKERDGFTCQVCEFYFADRYGNLGRGFAEAHHRVPLGSPKAKKTTALSDLVTVCANCHRMLHRREGMTVGKLKAGMTGY